MSRSLGSSPRAAPAGRAGGAPLSRGRLPPASSRSRLARRPAALARPSHPPPPPPPPPRPPPPPPAAAAVGPVRAAALAALAAAALLLVPAQPLGGAGLLLLSPAAAASETAAAVAVAAPAAPAVPLAAAALQPSDDALFDEAWSLVDDNYLGARRPFDRAGWARVRQLWRTAAPPRPDAPTPVSRLATRAAVAAAVAGLGDPYSRWVSPFEFGAMLRYDASGVGLNLGDDERSPSGLAVLGVVMDGEAAKAGVSQGDFVVSLDGAPLKGLSPFQASARLAAAPRDRPLALGLLRPPAPGQAGAAAGAAAPAAAARPLTATIPPAAAEKAGGAQPFALPSPFGPPPPPGAPKQVVRWSLDGATGVGTLAVSELSGAAPQQAAAALRELTSRGATSLALDLRGCPGGLVAAGVEVARLFLQPSDTVAYAAGRVQAAGGLSAADAARAAAAAAAAAPGAGAGSAAAADAGGFGGDAAFSALRRVAAGAGAEGAPPPTPLPLAVLVDGGTASAAELLAAALRDNCRAPLVGSHTFGKGLVQSVYELGDGSGLVLTVGTYVRPGGGSLDGVGLKPDAARWRGAAAAQRALEGCVRPRAPPAAPPAAG